MLKACREVLILAAGFSENFILNITGRKSLKHHMGKISQKLCFTLMKLYIELLWYLLKHKIVKYFVFFPWRYLTCIRAWHPIHILKFQNAHQTYFENCSIDNNGIWCFFERKWPYFVNKPKIKKNKDTFIKQTFWV